MKKFNFKSFLETSSEEELDLFLQQNPEYANIPFEDEVVSYPIHRVTLNGVKKVEVLLKYVKDINQLDNRNTNALVWIMEDHPYDFDEIFKLLMKNNINFKVEWNTGGNLFILAISEYLYGLAHLFYQKDPEFFASEKSRRYFYQNILPIKSPNNRKIFPNNIWQYLLSINFFPVDQNDFDKIPQEYQKIFSEKMIKMENLKSLNLI